MIDLAKLAERVTAEVEGVEIRHIIGSIPECRYIEVGPQDHDLYSVYETGEAFMGFSVDLKNPQHRRALNVVIDFLDAQRGGQDE